MSAWIPNANRRRFLKKKKKKSSDVGVKARSEK